jgi:hypothetical protein
MWALEVHCWKAASHVRQTATPIARSTKLRAPGPKEEDIAVPGSAEFHLDKASS